MEIFPAKNRETALNNQDCDAYKNHPGHRCNPGAFPGQDYPAQDCSADRYYKFPHIYLRDLESAFFQYGEPYGKGRGREKGKPGQGSVEDRGLSEIGNAFCKY